MSSMFKSKMINFVKCHNIPIYFMNLYPMLTNFGSIIFKTVFFSGYVFFAKDWHKIYVQYC